MHSGISGYLSGNQFLLKWKLVIANRWTNRKKCHQLKSLVVFLVVLCAFIFPTLDKFHFKAAL